MANDGLIERLEDALNAVSSAGDYMADHYGLDHRGYEAYLAASEAIEVLLGLIKAR